MAEAFPSFPTLSSHDKSSIDLGFIQSVAILGPSSLISRAYVRGSNEGHGLYSKHSRDETEDDSREERKQKKKRRKGSILEKLPAFCDEDQVTSPPSM